MSFLEADIGLVSSSNTTKKLKLKQTLTWSEVTANMKRKRDYWVSLFPLARNEKKEKDLARERKLLKEFTAILYCWIELCRRD